MINNVSELYSMNYNMSKLYKEGDIVSDKTLECCSPSQIENKS